MMIYKDNFSYYYYVYLGKVLLNYILMAFLYSIMHEFTYRVDGSPLITTFLQIELDDVSSWS